MFLYKMVVCEKYGLYWYFKKANLLPNCKYYMRNVKDTIKKLISALGGKFSKELGIDLSKGFLQKYSSGFSPQNSLAHELVQISP